MNKVCNIKNTNNLFYTRIFPPLMTILTTFMVMSLIDLLGNKSYTFVVCEVSHGLYFLLLTTYDTVCLHLSSSIHPVLTLATLAKPSAYPRWLPSIHRHNIYSTTKVQMLTLEGCHRSLSFLYYTYFLSLN